MDKNMLLDHIMQHVTLSQKEIDFLWSKISERKYLKGHYILQNGDICTSTNFIIQGAVKVFHIDNLGKEHIMMLGLENWWAADLSSFITQKPAAFNIQSLEHTHVLKISHEDHAQLIEGLPKMNKYFRIIIENAFVATQDRIIKNFSLSAKERYLHFSDKYPEHITRFPQYLIASYLGITKEFLSKIRSQRI